MPEPLPSGGRRAARPFPHTDEQLARLNPVGGLVCVNMRNFMCHSNFTQHFYAGVNYITGENGSGKSAVVVALSAALGANCNKIGKGDDLSNLIGTAGPIAVVTVTLRNDPANPRHVSKYKDPVVVERTLVKRSESDKISNKATIKIDGKEVRKMDLVELMTAMAIDIGNPAVVLHQDAAKSFGEQNDGKDLYNYFLDATGLRISVEKCEHARQAILTEKEAVKQVLEVKSKLQNGEFALAKEEMEKCSDLNEMKKKIAALHADLSVLKIQETIEIYDTKQDELHRFQDSKAQVDSQIQQLRRDLIDMQLEHGAEVEIGSSALDDQMTSMHQQHQHLSQKAQKLKVDRERKLTEKAQIEGAIRKVEKQIKDEEFQRDQARKEFERQDPNKGLRAAAKLKDEADALLSKAQNRQQELESIQSDLEESDHEWRRVQAQFEDTKKQITSVEEEIKAIQSRKSAKISRDDIIRKFMPQGHGQNSPVVDLIQVRNAIDTAHRSGLIRGPLPLGPLGMHISLKPEGRQFYQPIALALGQKLLGAFLFDSFDDKEAFLKSKPAQSIPNIRMITMWVLPQTVRHAASCSPTFQALPGVSTHTCIEFVIFDNPWVETATLHFAKFDIHQVVERYDRTLGHKALDSLRGLKANVVIRAIDGHECSASSGGGVQSTTNNTQVRRDIFDRPDTFDAEASLRELEADKRSLSLDYQRIDKEKKGCADRQKEKKDRIDRLMSEISGLNKKRKQNLAEAKDLELEAEQMQLEFDESPYLESIKGKQQIASSRREELMRITADIESIEKLHADVQTSIKSLSEKRQQVELELQKIQEKQEQATKKRETKERDLEKATLKLSRLAEAMAPISSDIRECLNKVQEWISTQSKDHTYEPVIRNIDDIRNRANEVQSRGRGVTVQSLQKMISTEQRLFQQKEASLQLPEGGVETVNARFREQELKMQQLTVDLDIHKKNYDKLIQAHKNLYDRHSTLSTFLEESAQDLYFENLEIKGYIGKLVFDHDKRTLVSSVDVNSRSGPRVREGFGGHKQLSGGENSYSNVCLLLALSAISSCPWQVLDEFDVFMCGIVFEIFMHRTFHSLIDFGRDQNHRKLALELICDSMKFESGSRICKSQMIFITPHSIPQEIAEKPEVFVSVVVRPAQ